MAEIHYPKAGLVVYGGSAASFKTVEAFAAIDGGERTAILVTPDDHIGAMSINSLTATDYGTYGGKTIGDFVTGNFFKDIAAMWGSTAVNLRGQSAATEYLVGRRLRQVPRMIPKTGLRLLSVNMTGTVIDAITCADSDGNHHIFTADIFVEATEEGDLMHAAGVSTILGREADTVYGETLAGWGKHLATSSIIPYNQAGEKLFGVEDYPIGLTVGDADDRVMPLGLRTTITLRAGKRATRFFEPPGYDESLIELLIRQAPSEWKPGSPTQEGEFDHNSDLWAYSGREWVEASWAERDAIYDKAYAYWIGWHWWQSNSPSSPASLRASMLPYGYAIGEFPDNHRIARQLYVRAGRRLIGEYVLNQNDTQQFITKSDAIAVGTYSLDTHIMGTFAQGPGLPMIVENARFGVPGTKIPFPITGAPPLTYRTLPYQVPARCLLPKEAEASNLLVASNISLSAVAQWSLRMEKDRMNTGAAAGVIAALALDGGRTVHEQAKDEIAQVQSALTGRGHVIALDPYHL
ncbi:FAD-dependent oxidoreductase [Zavarzinia aquatilis]|uniref:FAD-dependent oxidoreductase n=1 Tax=Zavarzinia aquatilis TaxID=2211142 RepID=A0A317EFX8_9PROT|nr:FAD-dependent oxidoreductase [Zavarzinia aquatilis]PWR24990.1 hypothetical protein DKG74_04265 [Zavarzinia aquatilis]